MQHGVICCDDKSNPIGFLFVGAVLYFVCTTSGVNGHHLQEQGNALESAITCKIVVSYAFMFLFLESVHSG